LGTANADPKRVIPESAQRLSGTHTRHL